MITFMTYGCAITPDRLIALIDCNMRMYDDPNYKSTTRVQ